MVKDKLLREIAESAYEIGLWAKKNFASYDIITKLPGWISFLVLVVGILQLTYNSLNLKIVSVALIIASISGIYISMYNKIVDNYENEGKRLIELFDELKDLYFNVESSKNDNFAEEEKQLGLIKKEFNSKSISKQVFLSDWFAHFKFFTQMQISWVNKELKFNFFKDKMPSSLKLTVVFIIILIIIYNLYSGNI